MIVLMVVEAADEDFEQVGRSLRAAMRVAGTTSVRVIVWDAKREPRSRQRKALRFLFGRRDTRRLLEKL